MQQLLEEYFDRLWPLCRSITGEGYQESLDIISELIPFEKIDIPSGTKAYDWVVPNEWNIKGGWIYGPAPESKKIVDFADNNLHVVGYSIPANGILPWKVLRNHIYTVPEMHNVIPYITSYYKKRWGFCMTHKQYLELEKDPEALYTFEIDSSLAPGVMTLGNYILEGKLDQAKDIFLSSYLCHPSMAINELSGPLVLAGIYKKLKEMKQLNNNVRIYIGPENIGAVAYLDKFGFTFDMLAGYTINCVGHKKVRHHESKFYAYAEEYPRYVYKRSRQHDSLTDRAALHIIRSKKCYFRDMDFFPDGSDERQWCSPAYNLPVGLLMRHCYGDYPEYHTSADNKDLICFDSMVDMIDTYVEIILTIDKNKTYQSTVQYGTPFFSKDPENDLYGSTMKLHSCMKSDDNRRMMLDVINWSTGKMSLLQIADKCGHYMLELADVAEELVEAGYLRVVSDGEVV